MRSFLIVAATLLFISCQAKTTSTDLVGKIPFHFEDDMIFIQVKINDSPAKKFLFDTGASITLVSKSLGEELGMQNGKQVGNIGATGKGNMEAFGNNKLSIGNIELDRVTIMKNLKKLPKSSPVADKFDGAIGYDILSNFIVKINYDSNELELYSFGDLSIPDHYEAFTINLSYNIPMLTASLTLKAKQCEGNFLLDTGSQMPVIFNSPMARKNKIASQIDKSIAIEAKAGVSEVSSKFVIFRGQQLAIFRKSFDQIPSAYSTASSGALASTGFQGIIGNPVLKRFNIILDYSKEKMYVSPGKLFDVAFLADCSGIAFDVKRDDKKLIAEYIVEGSPAEKAGISVGDELITINGKSSENYTSDELDNLLRQPGNQLRIQYRRDRKLLEASLVTKDLL